MHTDIQTPRIKTQGLLALLAFMALGLGACSTNPATGEQQFTALMSPQQEAKVGASEHQKIVQQFGLVQDLALQSYVDQIGVRLAKNTERSDVQYKFYILDSPIVNAFALPGGYVYVSRGLLALANNEAELAGVIGHEIAHVTARHSAERYSTSVVTSLGAAVVSAAVGSSGVSQALGLGSNLYLSSYSRGQENEADTLGIRYLARGGYDTGAMSSFLNSLQNDSALEARIAGKEGNAFSYFSTHPATGDRVSKTMAEAGQYPQQSPTVGRDSHLAAISGMIYGDSPSQGFVRGANFYHTGMGFTFSVPSDYRMVNQPTQVIATSPSGGVVVFDMVAAGGTTDPAAFLTQVWMKDNEAVQGVERISVNGLPAATASFSGKVNGNPMTIRVLAISWNGRMVRFQYAIPSGASAAMIEDLKRSSYSFRTMTAAEKQSVKPYRLQVVTAGPGDSVATLARKQPFDQLSEQRFRALNGLSAGAGITAGQKYKLVVE